MAGLFFDSGGSMDSRCRVRAAKRWAARTRADYLGSALQGTALSGPLAICIPTTIG